MLGFGQADPCLQEESRMSLGHHCTSRFGGGPCASLAPAYMKAASGDALTCALDETTRKGPTGHPEYPKQPPPSPNIALAGPHTICRPGACPMLPHTLKVFPGGKVWLVYSPYMLSVVKGARTQPRIRAFVLRSLIHSIVLILCRTKQSEWLS